MEAVWWLLTLGLMLLGLVGTLVPLVPGTILILCGAVLNHFALHSIGWRTLAAMTFMMIAAQALDIVSGSLGAKWFGATRWGAIGGILGALVGLFFGLIGIFVGRADWRTSRRQRSSSRGTLILGNRDRDDRRDRGEVRHRSADDRVVPSGGTLEVTSRFRGSYFQRLAVPDAKLIPDWRKEISRDFGKCGT